MFCVKDKKKFQVIFNMNSFKFQRRRNGRLMKFAIGTSESEWTWNSYNFVGDITRWQSKNLPNWIGKINNL